MSKTDPQNAIDLFRISNEENQHYCWKENFSRLVSSRISKHKCAAYFCEKCLKKFTTPARLNNHIPICEGSPGDIKVLNSNINQNSRYYSIVLFRALNYYSI